MPQAKTIARVLFWAALISGCTGTDSSGPGTDAVVANVAVALPRPIVHPGDSVQASATVSNSGGAVIAGKTLTWSSDNSNVAVVSSSGMVKAVDIGVANISASVDGKSGSLQLKVVVVPLASVTIVPDTATLEIGRATALAIVVKDSVGNTVTNRSLTWTTSDSSKARVSQSGIVTAIAAGTVDIIATAESRSGTARISIVAAPRSVANVSVSIPRTAFRVGENLQAAALPLDSLGGVLSGRNISWSSSDQNIVTVSSSGMVTAVGPGTASVTAESEGKAGSVIVQITLVPVATVTVSPSTQTVSAGASLPLIAILKDSADRILSGRSVSWSSSATSIAPVSQDGVVSGVLVGNAVITASSEGKTGTAAISVNTLTTPVATITLSASTPMMSGGATKLINATLKDANGNVIGGRNIDWTTSSPDKAVVSNSGVVTSGSSDGQVTITASVEGKSAAITIDILTFVRLSTGAGFTCGLTADGTAYCWGGNWLGQLGDGTTTSRLVPTKVATGLKFVAIASSADHSCAIAVGSLVYCWGANTGGKLGTVTTANSLAPTPVSGGYQFVSIAPSTNTTCGTTADRDVYCWGQFRHEYMDIYGGYVRFERKTTPVKIASGMVAVVAGLDGRYCSVDPSALAYCWQPVYVFPMVPPGFPSSTPNPIIGAPVSSTMRFTTLRMGLGHVCGIVETGQAYCWGNNDYGQLGNGTTTSSTTPVAVAGALVFESLAAGGTPRIDDDAQKTFYAGFTCGLVQGGKAYCWGANRVGELGTGSSVTFVTSPQPVSIPNVMFTGLRAGTAHVCGLAIGGPAYCWGGNASGQFGNGTTNSSNIPIPVFGR